MWGAPLGPRLHLYGTFTYFMLHIAVQRREQKNLSLLAELLGLCNILLLEAFKSFPTKDECKVVSSTVQPNSLFPGVKTAALTHLHSLTLLSGRLSCYLRYFECLLSPSAAAKQGFSHHDISTLLR